MDDLTKLLLTFVDAIALLMALVLIVSILHRRNSEKFKYTIMMGGIFAIGMVATMSDPIDLGSKGIFDMRGLLIGTATALLGPIVGGMALVTGLIYRSIIGGPGMVPGLFGMLCTFTSGLIFLYLFSKKEWLLWKKASLLGVMITTQLFAVLLYPVEMWAGLYAQLLPYTLATNVLGALLISFLLSGEFSFLSEAEAARIRANTDDLTGLLNRRGLHIVYPSLTKDRHATKGRALLYFDIDKFKSFNDSHGHSTGDAVLKHVADQIGMHLRPDDIFARLGGDEFAVILNRIDANEAQRIAERCRSVVEENSLRWDGKLLDVTISVGAVWMLNHTEIDRILDLADQALYKAKSQGRNRMIFHRSVALMAPKPVTSVA